jgi:hypothetical protein
MAERRETWTNAETQTTFECPRSLLCELAGLAMAGFNLSPAGGPEIGGILFGTRTPGHVRIVTHRPLPCEHAFGPPFELTDRDKSGQDADHCGAGD